LLWDERQLTGNFIARRICVNIPARPISNLMSYVASLSRGMGLLITYAS
jgi:hypothetical protein